MKGKKILSHCHQQMLQLIMKTEDTAEEERKEIGEKYEDLNFCGDICRRDNYVIEFDSKIGMKEKTTSEI